MVTELMFEKQRKVKQLNTEKAEEEKKKKKKQKRKQSTSSSSSASSDSDDLEIIGENDKSKVFVLFSLKFSLLFGNSLPRAGDSYSITKWN